MKDQVGCGRAALTCAFSHDGPLSAPDPAITHEYVHNNLVVIRNVKDDTQVLEPQSLALDPAKSREAHVSVYVRIAAPKGTSNCERHCTTT